MRRAPSTLAMRVTSADAPGAPAPGYPNTGVHQPHGHVGNLILARIGQPDLLLCGDDPTTTLRALLTHVGHGPAKGSLLVLLCKIGRYEWG